MNTLQAELQACAFHALLHSLQACLSVVMDTLSNSEPQLLPSSKTLPSARWTEQEITDLVTFLYEHRSEASGSNFKAPVYTKLQEYLSQRHPHRQRTREAIISKFRSVSLKFSLDF
jgi:hypothetical protein